MLCYPRIAQKRLRQGGVGAEMDMNVTSKNIPFAVALEQPFSGERVMNAICGMSKTVFCQSRTVKTVPANNRAFRTEQTILEELDVGIAEINQSLGQRHTQ